MSEHVITIVAPRRLLFLL